MTRSLPLSRRTFAAAGALGLAGLPFARGAFGNTFPARNMSITTPTGEGGGADRDARIFCQVWQKYLDTNFEFGFFPGAAGQVGYEHYLQRVEPDPHHLLNTYIGPEVLMLTLQAPHIRVGEDFVYIQQFVEEPMCIFTGANSPIQSIEQLVETGRQRTVNISKSRLPHPASICTLSLGEATGAQFNLIPYGGGNPSAMAAITGEVDACALPMGIVLTLGEQVRTLCVFLDENPLPERSNNAPSANAALGVDVPSLTSARSWAIHGQTIADFPEEMEVIRSTMVQVLEDPEFTERMTATGLPAEFISIAGEETAMASARATAELAERYRDLLTAG